MKPSIRVNLVFVLVPAGYAFKPETVQTVLASRTEILDEQDRGLDSLYEVIVRQKRIAQNIEGEVEVQVTTNISWKFTKGKTLVNFTFVTWNQLTVIVADEWVSWT